MVSDVIATNPPKEVVHPHDHNSFALEDGRFTEDAYRTKRLSVVDTEAIGDRNASVIEREQYPTPTEEEATTLRKVAGNIPNTAWLLCLVEFSERASYYGVKTVFSNFMQFPLPKGGNGAGAPPPGSEETAGALGRGIGFSVPMGLLFTFLSYVIPIFGGWIADAKIGRFRAILIGVLICGISHIIMICGAIPSVLQAGNGMAPFIVSFLLLAFGAVGVGRVVQAQMALSAVAREAARQAALSPLPPGGSAADAKQDGESRGQYVARGYGLNTAVVSVEPFSCNG